MNAFFISWVCDDAINSYHQRVFRAFLCSEADNSFVLCHYGNDFSHQFRIDAGPLPIPLLLAFSP